MRTTTTQPQAHEMDTVSEMKDVLSDRDIRFLRLLDTLVQRGRREKRSGATIKDLDRIAALLENGPPTIVFQPIFDLASGGVQGYEALSRFDGEPHRSPAAWFAHAHQVGLGKELELKAAGAAFEAMPRLPAGTYLSVNISAATLVSSEFQALLAPLAGPRVVVEVAEQDFVEDYEAISEVLSELRRNGFRLAVDDAGSGCAGLAHIVSLAPDVIKLDGTITRHIEGNAYAREIVASVVVLARYWASIVVAEGIETQEQLATLREIGVERGQGFLLGRPQALPE